MITRARAFVVLAVLAALTALAQPLRAEVTIQEVTSPGGINAWLVEDHAIPFIAMDIWFAGGTSLDRPGKRGEVNLMTALIEEGTGDLDAQGFAAARDALAAGFSFDSGADGVSVSVKMLSENRDAAAALLRGALMAPRFDLDAVDRVQGQVLANIRSNEQDPSALAWNAVRTAAFGDHPYGSDDNGTLDSVQALTRDDMIAAHQATLTRDRVTVGVSGDITAAELGPLLDLLIGDLPALAVPLPGAAPVLLTGGVKVIDFPGPQSTIAFGHEGIAVKDPDYLTASLLNEILGGGRFSARLMSEVREKRGLTYGISTGLQSYDQAALIAGQFQASNDKVAEAIAVIRTEWARIADEPIPEDELARAKSYMTGSYPLRWKGNDAIASILVGMQENGLAIDYPKTRNERVEAISADDLSRVATRLFDADALTFFVVGQPVGVADGN
jgi:zinc protease